MHNIYLLKIVEAKLREPDAVRAGGRAALYGGLGVIPGAALAAGSTAAGFALGHKLGNKIGPGVGGAVLGLGTTAGLATPIISAYHGAKASLKNQRREQDLHDIKLQGAKQRQEMHDARMRKMAEEKKDPNQLKKDLANTGIIAAMGGAGNTVADRIVHGPKGGGGKAFAVGTGVGLVADYLGVKINNAVNKKIDQK